MPKIPLKLVDEPSDEGVLGPARLVVIREPDSGRSQPLPDAQRKGKEKVVDEQAAHYLLTLQTPKKKSPADQFIFQRRTPMPTEAYGHAESPSLDAELALTDSETESDNEVPKINSGDQDEGQAGPNPGDQDEGQTGSNPGDAAESQPQSSHVVHAGPNLEHMDLEATDTSTQQKPEQMDEDFTDQFFVEKPQEEEPGKTNAEAEVQLMVSVPIHQDTSSVPPMTTPIGEIEQHMTDLIQNKLALEERLDKQGTRLYNLENLNIPHKVSQAVDEIVTDAVEWAMQAPLRARFRDLPTVDMKEILQQRMFEDNSYKAQDVHNDLYEALQKSLETPSGSPPLQPPPPPPLADPSGTPGTSGASRFSQLPPPPPHPSTGTSGSAQQQGSKALSSSKTATSASQSMAWTTSDTRYESAGVSRAQELSPTDSLMQDDSILDEQVHLSDDEDSMNDHLPKADSRKDWWKPLPEEERPTTPKPAWIIPSSNVSAIENN
ncbi:hypothetical protein Tco_0514917 [Tanacetum coccineum]